MSVSPKETQILPPTPFVRHFSDMLMIKRLEVLDVGCCIGRSALYLASLGHDVTAIDPHLESLDIAQNTNSQNVRYIAADARMLPFKKQFDVILMNEVLHQIPKEDHAQVYKELKSITKPNGIHAISDYIGNKDRALNPLELYHQYTNPNWEILEYSEDPESLVMYGTDTQLNSLAKIIAIRR